MPRKYIIWNDFNWDHVSSKLRKETLTQHDFVQGADALAKADIAFGKPSPSAIRHAAHLRWIQLSSAGYSEYDNPQFKETLQKRGVMMTNSSDVYAEPCAEHVFAMMLALARGLPQAMENQLEAKAWNHREQRGQNYLLKDQRVLLLGFGSIARRLVELLEPLKMQISVLRRHPSAEPNLTMITEQDLPKVLLDVDHIVNTLPENDSTQHFVNQKFLAQVKPNARLYNIGRGTTVDQQALITALRENRLAAAYLDVTTPEPLPSDHALWDAPHCFITPHSAGGHHDEFDRLLHHFLKNLSAFANNEELVNRIS